MRLDGLHADGGSDMGLACAGATDEDDIAGLLEEVAAMQQSHQGFVDLAAGEVDVDERGYRAEPWRADCLYHSPSPRLWPSVQGGGLAINEADLVLWA